jgi:hypothetical protein
MNENRLSRVLFNNKSCILRRAANSTSCLVLSLRWTASEGTCLCRALSLSLSLALSLPRSLAPSLPRSLALSLFSTHSDNEEARQASNMATSFRPSCKSRAHSVNEKDRDRATESETRERERERERDAEMQRDRGTEKMGWREGDNTIRM